MGRITKKAGEKENSRDHWNEEQYGRRMSPEDHYRGSLGKI